MFADARNPDLAADPGNAPHAAPGAAPDALGPAPGDGAPDGAPGDDGGGAGAALPPDDHRALAQRLDLCHFQDEAPGMAFWHPRGFTLYRLLEELVRAHVRGAGYREVRTPQLLRRPIWEASGHWGSFHGAMFALGEGADEAALKPVSCPGHIQIVRRMAPSWRDLPLRIAELGLVHRDEASGTLHGLLRMKQFTQDDGHVFCAPDDVPAEAARFAGELCGFYRRLGFKDLSLALSLRPPAAARLGDDAVWDRAERVLADVVAGLGVPCEVQPGAGAIYGPKIELLLRDRRGRRWQCGTLQIDFVMPARFDLRYVDASGARRHVAILHRALLGSLERFIGILLEHHGAELPGWLAPEQVAVIPVGAAHAAAAAAAVSALAGAGLRARLDASAETLGRRVRRAHHDGVPFVVVVGDREVAGGTLAARAQGGAWSGPAAEVVAELARRAAPPAPLAPPAAA